MVDYLCRVPIPEFHHSCGFDNLQYDIPQLLPNRLHVFDNFYNREPNNHGPSIHRHLYHNSACKVLKPQPQRSSWYRRRLRIRFRYRPSFPLAPL